MSKLDEKIAHYYEESMRLKLGVSEELIEKVSRSLGPSIFNRDAETVSCSDCKELETVKKNFLEKKLGIDDIAAIDAAVHKVCERMDSSNARKYRALFYALLVREFGKESLFE